MGKIFPIAVLGVALWGLPAQGQTDVDGDGQAVTFLGFGDIACPPGGGSGEVQVIVEMVWGTVPSGDGPTGPPAPPIFTLLDQNAPAADTLLMRVTIPPATMVWLDNQMFGPGLSGAFHLSFPLHCGDGCGVEGRADAVGGPSYFVPQPVGAPPGPPGAQVPLGSIGGAGGPLNEGIPIVAVGQSGSTCADIAVQTNDGPVYPAGGALCCGAGQVPASSAMATIVLSVALLAIGTAVLVRRRAEGYSPK